MRTASRERDERGAFLVLWALLLVALLTMAAIVIDLGQVRADRRSNQNAADYAALAAGRKLSGRDADPAVQDPVGACRDAVRALRRNVKGFPSVDETPCTTLPSPCTDSSTRTTATFPDASPYTLTIEYPVEANAIKTAQYDSTPNDGTKQCARMRVNLSKKSDSFFRGVINAGPSTVKASAVIRGELSQDTQGVAALLLLERTACGSLQVSGASQGGGVRVQAASNSVPGRIQADSAGTVGQGCNAGLSVNANNYVIVGTERPQSSGGGPSILAENAPDGTPGVMGIYAVVVGSPHSGADYPTGIFPAPSAGDIASRKIVDDKYNNAANPTGAAVTAFRQAALDSFAAAPAGFTTITAASCTNPTAAQLTAAKVYADCLNFAPATSMAFTGTDFVFNGKVTVASNTLAFPNAKSIAVRGCLSSAQNCNGSNNYSVSVSGGTLLVNTGNGTTDVACSSRAGPGAGGTVTNWTKFAQMSGPFLVTANGKATLCQTFVLMGEASVPQTTTSGGNCTLTLPCPLSGGANGGVTGKGFIQISGGSASADWSAPNQLSVDPTVGNEFEDIAFWQESSLQSTIAAQGSNRTEGVFFMPNAPVVFSGQATQLQPLNAQFIASSLNLSGQGLLTLKPNPADSVKLPVPGLLSLIR